MQNKVIQLRCDFNDVFIVVECQAHDNPMMQVLILIFHNWSTLLNKTTVFARV